MAAMANGAFPQRTARESLVSIAIVLRCRRDRRTFRSSHTEKLAALLQFLLATAIAEESVVANALEPAGQNVQEESPDELICREGHGLLLIVVAIISPGEFHLAAFDVEDPMIGDGHPVGIAADVVDHLLWSGEGRFRVDDPFQVAHQIQMTVESLRIL